MRCFVSAGHGPRGREYFDPGTVEDGVIEHEVAEWISREMAHAMRGVEPHVVARGSLTHKIAYVNRWSRHGDVCVEIHLNGVNDMDVSGMEVFHAAGSKNGQHFAAELHAALVRIGRSPRGVKPDTQAARKQLAWCRMTKPWAALVEVAFLSNPDERQWLLDGGAVEAGAALAGAVDGWA